MFTHQVETDEFLNEIRYLPASDIAGMIMFEAIAKALPNIASTATIPKSKRKTVLRQLAVQADKIAERYKLEHSIDLNSYINGQEAA